MKNRETSEMFHDFSRFTPVMNSQRKITLQTAHRASVSRELLNLLQPAILPNPEPSDKGNLLGKINFKIRKGQMHPFPRELHITFFHGPQTVEEFIL